MKINFAILAPGKIAEKMAEAVTAIAEGQIFAAAPEGAELVKYAVASRDLKRAEGFAERWGFEKAYGSYEALALDPEVDLVYVASPHAFHYAHARLCLEHGKHVLLEKAFTLNEADSEKLIGLAREKGLLLAEAIWTRYMPARRILDEVIGSGIIGPVTALTANLHYAMEGKQRLTDLTLGAGALLDVGVYPINFALMAIHEEIRETASLVSMSKAGYDQEETVSLLFESGRLATLHSGMRSISDRKGFIYGKKGYIEVENINNPEKITVYDLDRRVILTPALPPQVNGYEYEVLACMEAIRDGQCECPQMPHDETLRVMRLCDSLRRQWGMVYPGEKEMGKEEFCKEAFCREEIGSEAAAGEDLCRKEGASL